ncbi:MAG: hypothetical protein ACPGGK_19150, partial [Pikeienuella sp.]
MRGRSGGRLTARLTGFNSIFVVVAFILASQTSFVETSVDIPRSELLVSSLFFPIACLFLTPGVANWLVRARYDFQWRMNFGLLKLVLLAAISIMFLSAMNYLLPALTGYAVIHVLFSAGFYIVHFVYPGNYAEQLGRAHEAKRARNAPAQKKTVIEKQVEEADEVVARVLATVKKAAELEAAKAGKTPNLPAPDGASVTSVSSAEVSPVAQPVPERPQPAAEPQVRVSPAASGNQEWEDRWANLLKRQNGGGQPAPMPQERPDHIREVAKPRLATVSEPAPVANEPTVPPADPKQDIREIVAAETSIDAPSVDEVDPLADTLRQRDYDRGQSAVPAMLLLSPFAAILVLGLFGFTQSQFLPNASLLQVAADYVYHAVVVALIIGVFIGPLTQLHRLGIPIFNRQWVNFTVIPFAFIVLVAVFFKPAVTLGGPVANLWMFGGQPDRLTAFVHERLEPTERPVCVNAITVTGGDVIGST